MTEFAIPRTSGKGVSEEVGVRVTVEVGVAVYVGVLGNCRCGRDGRGCC